MKSHYLGYRTRRHLQLLNIRAIFSLFGHLGGEQSFSSFTLVPVTSGLRVLAITSLPRDAKCGRNVRLAHTLRRARSCGFCQLRGL